MAQQRSNNGRRRAGGSSSDMSARRKRRQQVIKRRRILALTVIALALITIITVVIAATSAALKKAAEEAAEEAAYVTPPTVNTLTLNADGSVTCEEVSDYNEEDYEPAEDATKDDPDPLDVFTEEIESFLNSEISSFNKENGSGAMVLDLLQVKKGQIYVKITYATIEDYAAYTGYLAVCGTPSELSNDYDFSDVYVAVADGEKGDAVDGIDLMSESDATLLLIKENIRVVVPGGIVYISDYATELADINVVDIAQPDGNNDATTLTYIFYDTSIDVTPAVAEDDTEETEEE